MSQPVAFKGCTHLFDPPPGRDDMSPLPLFQFPNGFVTCWELTDAEIEEIVASRCVYMAQIGTNGNVFPSYVGSRSSVRSVTVDYGGIWK